MDACFNSEDYHYREKANLTLDVLAAHVAVADLAAHRHILDASKARLAGGAVDDRVTHVHDHTPSVDGHLLNALRGGELVRVRCGGNLSLL